MRNACSPAPSVVRPRRLWLRGVVMVVALLAVGSTLTLRAQTTTATAPGSPNPAPVATPAPTPNLPSATPQPLGPPAVPATTAAPDGYGNLGDFSVQPIYKLKEMFLFAPVINGIIAGLSVLSLMFFLWFMLTINVRVAAPPAFVNEITNLVLVGRYDAAAEACRRAKGVFIAPIILRCVENHGKSQSIIMSMIDTEGRRLSDIIWNRISYLADISNVAPMLGLLGTVIGMITAFFGLDKESGSIDSSVLSQGVGQAMATTMFGLMVGISALVFYSIIKSRATKSLAEAEAAVHTIADRIRNAEDDDEADEEPSKLL
ncbi:MAG: MotA/TolQ/ExbB proton channel family protein [Planctomycetota bacterium]